MMSRLKTRLNAIPVAMALAGLTAIVGLLAGCGVPAQERTAASAPSWPCDSNVPTISSTIPNDVFQVDQATMNCFAWQEFIALNWMAAPGERGVADPNAKAVQLGAPNPTGPTVWETYKDKTEVFLPNGAKPKLWNDPPPAPLCATGASAASALLSKPGTHVLSMSSAFGDFSLDETDQASGQWLADQSGNLVYYEIKLNQDEFNTIVDSGFYSASVQLTTAEKGENPVAGGENQVKLPAGCNRGPGCTNPIVGAIELKAAWRILTDPSQYGRYLTSQAVLVSPTGACSTATMGLVGLHIIHKTVSQPQFIWATFEQVDNVEQVKNVPPTFSSSSCQCETAIPSACFKTAPASTVYQNCLATQTQGQSCTANTPPPYESTSASCTAYPIQVTRTFTISNNSPDPVVATNVAAQQLIVSSNHQSVFQYYQLVDVLWSTSAQDNYANNQPGSPGPKVPLSMSGATPDSDAHPVANTTMETYVQGYTCLHCHVYATVAGSKVYASDFSFIMGDAQSPGVAATARPRRSLPKGLVTLQH